MSRQNRKNKWKWEYAWPVYAETYMQIHFKVHSTPFSILIQMINESNKNST